MLSIFGGRGAGERAEQVELWNEVAELLEERWARAAQAEVGRAPTAAAAEVLELAEAVGVCSFAQTIEAARQFLLEQRGARLHALVCKAMGAAVPFSAIRTLALHVVDEGHTAAVVRAEIALAKRPTLPLALLVARDLGAAAARLGAQASDLRVWHRMDPARAAEVLEDGTGSIRWFGQRREVPVVAVRWVEGQTLRPWSDAARGAGADALPAVAPRGTRDDDEAAPAGREELLGAGPRRDEAARRELAMHVARQLARTRSALATFALDGACERTIDVEQGDVLLDRRYDVVLVGSAARSWWGALGAWPYRLAGGQVGGGASVPAPLLAAEAVLAGMEVVARRPDGAALTAAMLQQARQLDVARRALEGLVAASEREPLVATVRELLPQLARRLGPADGE